jgi:hypothetical protein
LEEAERRGLFDMRDVEALIVRRRGRHGVRVLEQALGAYRDRPFTRSELERKFGDLCREAGLAPPAFNAWVAGHEVDALWRDQRLVVELDGHAFHRTRAASNVTASVMRTCGWPATAWCGSRTGG